MAAMGITIPLAVAAALVGTLPMADKVVLALAVVVTGPARQVEEEVVVAVEEATLSSQKTHFLGS